MARRPGRTHRQAVTWPLAALLGLVAIVALSVAALLWIGLRDDVRPVDVAVVLGNHVHGDGTPTPRLAARLDRAVELYQQGLFPTVIVSGGISSSGADEVTTMAAYLEAAGVPADAVVRDPAGVNTAATASNTAAWMQANGARSVLAVSQYFHIARIRLAFRQNGIRGIAHAGDDYWGWRDFFLVPRELAAITRYALLGG